jgi:hypothetical protein
MIELQFLTLPTQGGVAGFALRAHLRFMGILMTV